MMKHKGFLTGIFSVLLVFGLVLAGCGDDSDPSNPGGGDPLPAVVGENALSGRTYFDTSKKIVFSTTASGATSGSYKLWITVQEHGSPVLENGKYKYTEIQNGTYSWDETAKTVTLKPEKVARKDYYGDKGDYEWGALQNRTQYRATEEAYFADLSEEEIEEINEWFSDYQDSMGFSSLSGYLDYEVNKAFANKTGGYVFSTDNSALFLSEPLPANIGTNEVQDKEFTSEYSSNKVKFTSATAYTVKESGTEIETGEYGYDTSALEIDGKCVFLKPLTKNGKTLVKNYDSLSVSAAGYFETAVAAKAAQANDSFVVRYFKYNLSGLTIASSGDPLIEWYY
jgi:hypothetical protein